MRNFSWTGDNKPLSEEEFNELASTDKGLRSMRYPFKYQRSDDKTKTGMYVTVRNYNDVREFSQEQHERATAMFERRRNEVLDELSERGVLCFHAMGMDYEPTTEDGIGNHRIRSTFKDRTGHVLFVEVRPTWNPNGDPDEKKGFCGEVYDQSRNEAEMREYEEEVERLLNEYGGKMWKVPSNLRPNYPFCHYENVQAPGPFTYGHLLEWVNTRFGCDYKKMVLERYFLQCDEIISEC